MMFECKKCDRGEARRRGGPNLGFCFPRSRNPWPKQLNCPSQWFSRAAEAITPDCHCLGQCLFRWVNIGILICSLNQFLNRPMEGKFSDLTQRLLTGML